jgi:hypothetical protein
MNETFAINFNTTTNVPNIDRVTAILNDFFPNKVLQSSFDLAPAGYIEELLERYTLKTNSDDTINFLYNNDFLIPLIFEAEGKIKKYFPRVNKEDLLLEIFLNPETEEEKLSIIITVDMVPEEAIRRLNKLRHNWLIKVIDKTQWKLKTDVDFK